MNLLERMTVAIRHAPGLENAEWIWSRVRPLYDRALRASFIERGLERVINGTDRILLSPASRGFIAQTYEPEVWRRIMPEVRTGDVIVEVGASIGIYTLAFANRVRANGHVVAFEPDPASAAELEANIAVNKFQNRVSLMSAAVGASCGWVRFAAARGMESHVAIDRDDDASAESISIPLVTLDGVFQDTGINLLKIDVEGFEEPVLRGAQRLLADPARRPRAIVVEVHPFAWDAVGTASDSLLESLTRNRYRVASLAGEPVTRITEYGHIFAIAD